MEQGTLRVTALPGEVNDVTIASTLMGGVAVSDAIAPISSSTCAPDPYGGVYDCGPVDAVEVDLGDGDDGLSVYARVAITTLAGAGIDQIGCGPGTDTVHADVTDELDFACELVDYGRPGNVWRLRRVHGGGRFVAIPGMPWARIDRRLLPGLMYLVRKYKVRVGDGYAPYGHAPRGEHPLGLAVDLYPGPGGTWSDVDRLARWAEPRQDQPRPPYRWVGYNGDANHGNPRICKPARGCAPHLHLSWAHSPGRPRRPVRTVWVFEVR